jgi:tetratricopeptide (TPR) repeat protein
MAEKDADYFVGHLAAKGLTPSRKGAAEDVALVSLSEGTIGQCDWLEATRSGQSLIVWLSGKQPGEVHVPEGWKPGGSLLQFSPKELEQRVEFVRTQDNVDVYRDKLTGKELYTARTSASGEESDARHNKLYKEAQVLIEGLLLLGDAAPTPLSSSARQRLNKAIALYKEVIEIRPGNWAAMWLLGKVHQRLEDSASALHWFSRAHRTNPDQPDVAREAAIAAMESDCPSDAVAFCERAIEANPHDAGLQANLALALLFSDKPKEAQVVAKEALDQAPLDPITKRILKVIDEVLAGVRPCPHNRRDFLRRQGPWWRFWS